MKKPSASAANARPSGSASSLLRNATIGARTPRSSMRSTTDVGGGGLSWIMVHTSVVRKCVTRSSELRRIAAATLSSPWFASSVPIASAPASGADLQPVQSALIAPPAYDSSSGSSSVSRMLRRTSRPPAWKTIGADSAMMASIIVASPHTPAATTAFRWSVSRGRRSTSMNLFTPPRARTRFATAGPPAMRRARMRPVARR
mmetsp:Transcript_20976/g.74016  ORF Transcript_20976/g.74016 Transcript_20976/m.74016 type:complete len:202 (+) Transcript_20976:1800-2405(+)